MTEDEKDQQRVRSRAARPTGEERAAGVEDTTALAEAVLEDSDIRQEDRDAAPDSVVEHRGSGEATPPPDT